jgi:anti-sigma factor RsiW
MMNHDHFARKIASYFDGTLRDGEKTEFEAYVGTHSDFAEYFRQKEAEQLSLKLRVPNLALEAETAERLEGEVREAINNLFKVEDASLGQRLGDWLREKL